MTYSCPVIVCGDFNVHVDITDDPHAVRLRELLQTFGCMQHVTESTHKRGHILDLVIMTAATDISIVRVGGMLSDHALIHFTVSVKTLRVDENGLHAGSSVSCHVKPSC